MARTDSPSLSDGNMLYLYDLLKREIGCGKQTFLPRVEEALATDRMTGEDLGFESTRTLLEALGDMVTLTVFKGGRVYATLAEMPAWDEALAAADAPKATAPAGRPWKRKRGAKTLKPQRPRRVKRAEPEADHAAAEADQAPVASVDTAGDTGAETEYAPDARTVMVHQEPEAPMVKAEGVSAGTGNERDAVAPRTPDGQAGGAIEPERGSAEDDDPEHTGQIAEDSPSTPAAGPLRTPSISLTITYDPDEGLGEAGGGDTQTAPQTVMAGVDDESDGSASPQQVDTGMLLDTPTKQRSEMDERADDPAAHAASLPSHETAAVTGATASATGMAASPGNAASRLTPPSNLAASTPAGSQRPGAAASAPAVAKTGSVGSSVTPTPHALASYPRDFATEVHIPGPLLAELTRIMPFGADVVSELTRDFRADRGLGSLSGTRSQAVFPLRFDGGGQPVAVTIKRTPDGVRPWAVSAVEYAENTAPAAADLEGLPLVSPVEEPLRELAARAYLDSPALAALAEAAYPAVWDAESIRAQLAFALQDVELSAGDVAIGLFTGTGAPLLARFEETDEDIPWRLTGPGSK